MIYSSNEIIYRYFFDVAPQTVDCLQNPSDFYEIIYIFSGDAVLSVDNKIFKLYKRSVTIIPPTVKKRIFTDGDKQIRFFHIAFDKKILDNRFDNIDDFLCKPISSINTSSLHLLFLCIQALDRKNPGNDVFVDYLRHFIPLILLEITNSNLAKVPFLPASELMRNVLQYVDSKITTNITVESIANHFFVSRSFLSHEFKKNFNVSLKQHIIKKKMTYANKLIKAGVKPTKVSHTCGFDNYSTFFRQYKNYFGESPENHDKQ